jgi:hypothetical protein
MSRITIRILNIMTEAVGYGVRRRRGTERCGSRITRASQREEPVAGKADRGFRSSLVAGKVDQGAYTLSASEQDNKSLAEERNR